MYIMDLLTVRNSDLAEALAQARVKVVRHVLGSDRKEIKEWIGIDPRRFDVWQGRQKDDEDVFHDCEFVVSCVGLHPGTRARFVGVYRNESGNSPRAFNDVKADNELAAALDGVTPPALRQPSHCFYDLRKVRGFSDLERRVIIKWESPGKKASAQAWVQCAKTHRKKVDEILSEDIAAW